MKNLFKVDLKPYLYFLFFSFSPLYLFGDSLKSDQELKETPSIKGNVVGKAAKGNVEVIDKKGFWVKVKNDSIEGWTKLNNVEISKDSDFSLSSLNTGREGSGNIVSTSGVRGLDGEDITSAQPNLIEFDKLQSLKADKSIGNNFMKNSGLLTKKIKFIIVKSNNENQNESKPFGK
tara:strand:- start:247 stop:774 length:528 start_codon:yes stop_codon:yes gene_type:complete